MESGPVLPQGVTVDLRVDMMSIGCPEASGTRCHSVSALQCWLCGCFDSEDHLQ